MIESLYHPLGFLLFDTLIVSLHLCEELCQTIILEITMEPRELEIGDAVQLNPKHKFGGMLVIVTEPKKWGCQGYLMSAYSFEAVKFKGVAYVRPTFEDFEYVGKLQWLLDDEKEELAEK